ncbi:MAG: hypothetical protein JWN11_374 [Hyphomicrobiales bacterium]|nr:hypothetical protein [Hyphomicrobiales bacterium]
MSHDSTNAPIFDATIRIDNLPPAGRELKLAADATQRQALAELLEISAIERLDVTLNATTFRGGIRVLGRLRAVIEQPCVVTLVPVRQEIDEAVDRVFLPEADASRPAAASAEIFVDLDADDPPDHFSGPEADLSDLIIETLALAIDPYPRAPGASVDAPQMDKDDEIESPFSSLKALKDSGDKH